VSSFDDFYNFVVDREKKMRLQSRAQTNRILRVVFNKLTITASVVHVKLENDMFHIDEKIRILVSKYDPDYYVMVGKHGARINLSYKK
jgi:hypothetical protein